jgi:hypothetical protein
LVGQRNPQFAGCAKRIAYNSTFFCDSVVLDFVESLYAHSWRNALKNIMMHLDDARLHNSRKSIECPEQFHARKVQYPNYRPDLAPSDFFLFGYVKSN